MRFLRLPEGMASITVFDQTYGEDGIIRGPDGKGVEDHVAREIMAHDPRITEVAEEDLDDSDDGDNRHVSFMARIGSLDRTELFAVARALKISVPATSRNDVMKEIIVREAAKVPPEQLPLLLTGSGVAGLSDGIIMMPPEIAASPNRGNDGLGMNQMKHGSTGGATFHQGMMAGAAPASPPAPPGAGTITPAGMTQPPFNQLNTETGQPSHDANLAPFPITVPPINPETGQPYQAGDPRIPANAMPLARDTEAFHAAVDEHETRAAMAISEAADRLDDHLGGGPLLTTKQQADQQAGAAAAASATGSDPNHGNDTEGQKNKTALKN